MESGQWRVKWKGLGMVGNCAVVNNRVHHLVNRHTLTTTPAAATMTIQRQVLNL